MARVDPQQQQPLQQLQEKLKKSETDKKQFAERHHKAQQAADVAEAQNRNSMEEVNRLTHEINQLHYQVRGVVVGVVMGCDFDVVLALPVMCSAR